MSKRDRKRAEAAAAKVDSFRCDAWCWLMRNTYMSELKRWSLRMHIAYERAFGRKWT